MTEAESDMLEGVWSEAKGNADQWVSLTEVGAEALALSRNGYLQIRDDGRDIWRVALTAEGLDIARALFR